VKRWSKRWSTAKTIMKYRYFEIWIWCLTRHFAPSGWRDLNSRPLDPQIGGLMARATD
jgi:hypothetical protein